MGCKTSKYFDSFQNLQDVFEHCIFQNDLKYWVQIPRTIFQTSNFREFLKIAAKVIRSNSETAV